MQEYNSAFKRKEILTNDAKWMNCEHIRPSKKSQLLRDKYSMIPRMFIEQSNSYRQKVVVSRN